MVKREIIKQIKAMAEKMPIISITGPRQSGKTTVAKMCFPSYRYVNLENPDTMEEAMADPRSFLKTGKKGLIIDEIQVLPKLFSYIQTISDEHNRPGEFVITGSQNFLLSAKISQSLAGRVFISHLLPFSIAELKNTDFEMDNFAKYIRTGFYPRIYDKNIEPNMFYPSYIQTYAERDLRQIINVSNLFLFQKFMRLAAGRIGQLLNYNSIATELGVDLKTVKSWFSILETSFIIFFLQPHFNNFSKRLVKTPKLYFYDTGLACSLLGIKKENDLNSHWAKGALFENMIIADLCKNYLNKAIQPPLYFWRDNTGNEIDCIIDNGSNIKSIEIKSSSTISSDFLKGLNFYKNLNKTSEPYLVYGGKTNSSRNGIEIVSWKNILFLLLAISIAFAQDSLRISQIHVETKNVFDDAVTHTSAEKSLYRIGNIIHIKTRESVIGARLPFKEGDTVSYAEIQEAEKDLRALPYISDAKIEMKKDSLGNTDLYVETSDNWTFAPEVSLGKPGEKWLWAVGLLEHNLLGLGHTIGFFYRHEEERDLKYLLFKTEDFFIPHHKFSFIISENSDGFERSLGLSYPFISQAKNQWSYNAEILWSKRDEFYYENKNPNPIDSIEGLKEDSLSLWLLRSYGGASFKTYLGMGYDFHRIDSYGMKDSRLGFSIAASRIRLEKKYNLHRVKWAEDVERGYYIKTTIAKNIKEWQAENEDFYFEHIINISVGTEKHNFLAKGQNSFYWNNDSIGNMHNLLFGEYILKPSLKWSSVLSAQIESWQGSFPRQFYLDGNSIFPGFPAHYLAGANTFAFKAEQRYLPDFEILTQIPSFATFLTAGEATNKLRAFEPRELLYMAGIGLRVSSSKSVQGVVNHINLSWPLNDKLNNGFVPRFSFIGKLEL